MSGIAHGDDEVGVSRDVREELRGSLGQGEAVSLGGRDRAGGDRRSGMRTSGRRGDGAALRPELRGELGASGVGGTHEQDAPCRGGGRRAELFERTGHQVDIAAAPISLRSPTEDHSLPLEHREVMSDQVRGHAEPVLQLARSEVPQGEKVHDPQARGITEGRMTGGPRLQVSSLGVH